MEPLAVLFDAMEGPDDQARVKAYLAVMGRSDVSTDVYGQWERLVGLLGHKNNHIRSIGGQLFSHFAASDPEGRVWALWDRWTKVASDKMFVTARHTLQASPRFALGGPRHRDHVIAYYEQRFRSCATEKNATLVRYDLQVCLRAVYDQNPDPSLAARAQALIDEEADPKYQKKYQAVWKSVKV